VDQGFNWAVDVDPAHGVVFEELEPVPIVDRRSVASATRDEVVDHDDLVAPIE